MVGTCCFSLRYSQMLHDYEVHVWHLSWQSHKYCNVQYVVFNYLQLLRIAISLNIIMVLTVTLGIYDSI